MRQSILFAIVLTLGCEGNVKFEGDGVADTVSDGEDVAIDPAEDTVLDATGDAPWDAPTDTHLDTGADTAIDPVTDSPVDLPVDTVPDGYGCATTADCMTGLECCDGRCVNLAHDPDHCSECDASCPDVRPFCESGSCTTPPCFDVTCIGTEFCCGFACCALGEICCQVDGPGPTGGPECFALECPGGCPLCA